MKIVFTKNKKYILSVIVAIGFFVGGVILGEALKANSIMLCKGTFTYINADFTCGKKPTISKGEYAATERSIKMVIESNMQAGHITEAGVYFRDLRNGPVFGVNEFSNFAPASLLKLPLALAYLNIAEHDPEFLSKKLSFDTPTWNFIETFPPTKTISAKTEYTIKELLRYMLTYSDNNAYGVLQTYMHDTNRDGYLKSIYLELGFLDPSDISDDVMSVREYASIFRALYNASFLTAENSERVLGWLAQSDFTAGLAGGVPKNLTIAHKFGERFNPEGIKQLHDCGIVYYPQNPYLLCIMTRGHDFDIQAGIIQKISGIVYEEVNARKL